MFFELLIGMHTEGSGEDAVIYQAEKIWNKKHTQVIREYHPIIETERDLIAMWPSLKGKFRRLSQAEGDAWKKEHPDELSGIVQQGKDNIPNAAEVARQKQEEARAEQEEQERLVEEAAREGAKVIETPDTLPEAVPTGKNVTKKFDSAAPAKLSVFMKPGGHYTVFDDESGKTLNQTPIKQAEVSEFIEAYLET